LTESDILMRRRATAALRKLYLQEKLPRELSLECGQGRHLPEAKRGREPLAEPVGQLPAQRDYRLGVEANQKLGARLGDLATRVQRDNHQRAWKEETEAV